MGSSYALSWGQQRTEGKTMANVSIALGSILVFVCVIGFAGYALASRYDRKHS